MTSTFIHHVDTATALHNLRGMINCTFGCLKLHFRSKLCFKATSTP